MRHIEKDDAPKQGTRTRRSRTTLTSSVVDPDKRKGAALLDLPVDNAVRCTDVDITG
jgi:hypothetical protein